jgi:branched-chain amino acid aminotransferase
METQFVIKNGELIKKSEANISIYNKALFFDFVVYSNIKVVQGKMFLPELAIKKLFESAKIIGLRHDFNAKKIVDWTKELIIKNKITDALIRILLIGPEKDSEAELFLFPVGLTFHPKETYREGAKVITFKGERTFPTAKTKSLLTSYVAYREAREKGAIDALLIDKDNNIREGTRSSFFAIKDNVLFAPPKAKVLEGITRKIILEIAPNLMKCKIQDIPLEKIKDYDECFLTGTSLNIMPIKFIDDIEFKVNGAKTNELKELYKKYCDDAGVV